MIQSKKFEVTQLSTYVDLYPLRFVLPYTIELMMSWDYIVVCSAVRAIFVISGSCLTKLAGSGHVYHHRLYTGTS